MDGYLKNGKSYVQGCYMCGEGINKIYGAYKFCSSKCREETFPLFQEANKFGLKVKSCAQCKKPFFAFASSGVRPSNYCSKECEQKSNYFHGRKPCDHCGEEFRGPPTRRLCSLECLVASGLRDAQTPHQLLTKRIMDLLARNRDLKSLLICHEIARMERLSSNLWMRSQKQETENGKQKKETEKWKQLATSGMK